MKSLIKTCFFIFITLPFVLSSSVKDQTVDIKVGSAKNLIIVTVDGYRWQELFTGANEALINNTGFTEDTATIKALYWANTPKERREKLMPFFWNFLSKKGSIYGNRDFGNKVNVANLYAVSYPGYNEIFTGTTDLMVASNRKVNNKNVNVLEYLNAMDEFSGSVVAFTSWNVFPYILNRDRNKILVNSGYESMEEGDLHSDAQTLVNKVQETSFSQNSGTRNDMLTFLAATEYLKAKKPRVLFLGLGETDEFAHEGRYDLYLEQANKTDKMLAELWHLVQTTEGYKNNTSIIITTDHGRGSSDGSWTSHAGLIKGSSQTWLAMIGPGIEALGEVKEKQQLYQKQLAECFAQLLGKTFKPEEFKKSLASF